MVVLDKKKTQEQFVLNNWLNHKTYWFITQVILGTIPSIFLIISPTIFYLFFLKNPQKITITIIIGLILIGIQYTALLVMVFAPFFYLKSRKVSDFLGNGFFNYLFFLFPTFITSAQCAFQFVNATFLGWFLPILPWILVFFHRVRSDLLRKMEVQP